MCDFRDDAKDCDILLRVDCFIGGITLRDVLKLCLSRVLSGSLGEAWVHAPSLVHLASLVEMATSGSETIRRETTTPSRESCTLKPLIKMTLVPSDEMASTLQGEWTRALHWCT